MLSLLVWFEVLGLGWFGGAVVVSRKDKTSDNNYPQSDTYSVSRPYTKKLRGFLPDRFGLGEGT